MIGDEANCGKGLKLTVSTLQATQAYRLVGKSATPDQRENSLTALP